MSIRDPNFIMPKRSPRVTVSPGLQPADHAPREDADDLAADDGSARVIDPDLAPLVLVDRPRPGRPAGTCPGGTRRGSPCPETGMRLTCTSIGDRKMLICCQSPGGAGPRRVARDHDAAVGGRQHQAGTCGRGAVRIAEEEDEEGGERPGTARPRRGRRPRPRPRPGPARQDEREARAIDEHRTTILRLRRRASSVQAKGPPRGVALWARPPCRVHAETACAD